MTPHLTEDERQGAADGTLAADRAAGVEAHLAACEACASDVDLLRRVVVRLRSAPVDSAAAENDFDAWLAIRARVEQRKIVPWPAAAERHTREVRSAGRGRSSLVGGALTAAAVLVAALLVAVNVRSRPGNDAVTAVSVSAVADSTLAYRREAQVLLTQLELQRAMLRPETAASIDRSLRVIDDAIAELQEALARDPNNAALRRLLASSYREKVDLLTRVSNAS